jgi:hypothetical protein
VPFVIGVRFLPSGRVIGGLAAGVVRYPARRYALGAGIAEAVWASYSVGAGYISGRAASNSFYALTLGLGISLVVAGCGTIAQWISRSRERRSGGHPPIVVASYVTSMTVTTGPPRGPGVSPPSAGSPSEVPRPASRVRTAGEAEALTDALDDTLSEPLSDTLPAPLSPPPDDAGRWCPTGERKGPR